MNILIIGAGQLGSRHLQGISKINRSADTYIIDLSAESLRIAQERFYQTSNGNVRLHLGTSLKDVPNEIDIAIIATNSKPRLAATRDLLNHAEVKFLILEKVLFSSLIEYSLAQDLFAKTNTKIWVNCVRRSVDDYKELKKYLGDLSTLNMDLHVPKFAIASNAIHFIDLFVYLSNDDNITFDLTDLEDATQDAKREGYSEVNGILRCRNSKGILMINNDCQGDISQVVQITTNKHRVIIQESHNPTQIKASKDSNWGFVESTFRMPFQSELTTEIVHELIDKGTCPLPSYEKSSKQHISFIKALKTRFGGEIEIS